MSPSISILFHHFSNFSLLFLYFPPYCSSIFHCAFPRFWQSLQSPHSLLQPQLGQSLVLHRESPGFIPLGDDARRCCWTIFASFCPFSHSISFPSSSSSSSLAYFGTTWYWSHVMAPTAAYTTVYIRYAKSWRIKKQKEGAPHIFSSSFSSAIDYHNDGPEMHQAKAIHHIVEFARPERLSLSLFVDLKLTYAGKKKKTRIRQMGGRRVRYETRRWSGRREVVVKCQMTVNQKQK